MAILRAGKFEVDPMKYTRSDFEKVNRIQNKLTLPKFVPLQVMTESLLFLPFIYALRVHEIYGALKPKVDRCCLSEEMNM